MSFFVPLCRISPAAGAAQPPAIKDVKPECHVVFQSIGQATFDWSIAHENNKWSDSPFAFCLFSISLWAIPLKCFGKKWSTTSGTTTPPPPPAIRVAPTRAVADEDDVCTGKRDTPCGGLQILLQELINYSRVNRSFIKTCTHHKHPRPTSLDVYPAVTLYLPTWRIPPPQYLQPKKMNVNPPPDSERLIVL